MLVVICWRRRVLYAGKGAHSTQCCPARVKPALLPRRPRGSPRSLKGIQAGCGLRARTAATSAAGDRLSHHRPLSSNNKLGCTSSFLSFIIFFSKTYINRCALYKARFSKVRFSADFLRISDLREGRLFSRNTSSNPLSLIKPPLFTNNPCKSTCVCTALSLHIVDFHCGQNYCKQKLFTKKVFLA